MNNSVKGILVALLMAVAPSAFASTLPAMDYTVDVGIGAGVQSFAGKIYEGEANDNVLVNLHGSQGTLSAYVTEYYETAGTTGMSLFKWDGSVLGDVVATAGWLSNGPGNAMSYGLSAFLEAGSYVLQIYGPAETSYSGSVSAVPLPGAAILFGSALLGAGMLRRKKAGGTVEAVAA